MNIFYTLASGAYILFVISLSRRTVKNVFDKERGLLKKLEDDYQKQLIIKNQIYQEKMELQNEAVKIFTLYEITKDITKSLKQNDAFEIFKQKLHDHVEFTECRYVDAKSPEYKVLKKNKEYFVFALKTKRQKIGYLILKGVSDQEKEKVMILGHQFALALRRVRLYQEIEHMAITDSLTNVYTRRYTLDRFQEEINRSSERKTKVSYLMIDVDYFKNINDRYGHLTGDQILHEIGAVIKEHVREIDIVGRFGGEEFCVILPDTDLDGALYVAERIRSQVEQTPIKAYDSTVNTTVSIGISTYPLDGKKMNELIDKADWNLYKAKKQGRNRTGYVKN